MLALQHLEISVGGSYSWGVPAVFDGKTNGCLLLAHISIKVDPIANLIRMLFEMDKTSTFASKQLTDFNQSTAFTCVPRLHSSLNSEVRREKSNKIKPFWGWSIAGDHIIMFEDYHVYIHIYTNIYIYTYLILYTNIQFNSST